MESANNDGIFSVLFIQIFSHDFISIFLDGRKILKSDQRCSERWPENLDFGPSVRSGSFRFLAQVWQVTIGFSSCVREFRSLVWDCPDLVISVFGVGLPRSRNFGLWRGSDYGFRCRSFRVYVPFWKSNHDCWNCPSIILVSKLRSWIIRLKSSRKRNASDWIAVFILEKVSPWSHLCVIGSSGSTDYWALGIHRAIREAAV